MPTYDVKVTAGRGPLAVVVIGYAVAMGGTTMPTPIYPRLQDAFSLSTAASTQLFAIYALAVLVVLMLFGSLSDAIGRKPLLWAGLAAALASGLCYALADTAAMLFFARTLSGVCAGLVTGTATAFIADLIADTRRSAAVSSMANMAGLGSGPIFASLVCLALPRWPMAPFAVHAGLCLICAALLFTVPESVRQRGARVRLSLPLIPRESWRDFSAGGIMTVGFAVMGGCTAITSILIVRAFGISNLLLLGVIGSLIFAATTLGQKLYAQRIAGRPWQGFAGLGFGALLIGLAPQLDAGPALACYLAGLVAAGLSHGALFPTGLAIVLRGINPHQRGSASSAFWVLGYALTALGAVALGWMGSAWGEADAVGIFGAAILAASVLAAIFGPRSSPRTEDKENAACALD